MVTGGRNKDSVDFLVSFLRSFAAIFSLEAPSALSCSATHVAVAQSDAPGRIKRLPALPMSCTGAAIAAGPHLSTLYWRDLK
jgi:hypothetical protein